MGLFDRFKRPPKRFVEPAAFESALLGQLAMTPQTMAQLRELGVTPASRLRLEFFFYTNTSDKAAALVDALAHRGYDASQRVSATDKSLRVVTGWTTPLEMADAVVADWTAQMCRLGFAHDVEFDGWGTTPQQ